MGPLDTEYWQPALGTRQSGASNIGRPFRTRPTRPFATPTPVEKARLVALRLGIASREHRWHILKRGTSNQTTGLAHPHRWNIESNNRFGTSSPLEHRIQQQVWHILRRGTSNPTTGLAHPHRWSCRKARSLGASLRVVVGISGLI